jgi:hypothetical protein
MDFVSPDPRARTQPRLSLGSGRRQTPPRSTPGLGLNLGSGRRRTPPRPTLGLGLSLGSGRRWTPPRPTPGLGHNLDLGGASASPDLGLGPTTSQGAIITLPLASSGYGERDQRPIWLAPVNK